MRVTFLSQGNNWSILIRLELTTGILRVRSAIHCDTPSLTRAKN